MTRKEAWLACREQILGGAEFAAVAYGERRIVVCNGHQYVEVEMDRPDVFALLEALSCRVDGRAWSRADYDRRMNAKESQSA